MLVFNPLPIDEDADYFQRCGKRLHIDVQNSFRGDALKFAKGAAVPLHVHTVVERTSYTGGSTHHSSHSEVSVEGELPDTGPPDGSLSTSPGDYAPKSVPPAGAKKYMLLCVNSGIGLPRMYNIDVTNAGNDEEVFARLRKSYGNLRRSILHRLFISVNVEYIKVSVLNPFRLQIELTIASSNFCICEYQETALTTLRETRSPL